MTSREPPNPVVRRLAAAINDGGRDTPPATLAPNATLGSSRVRRTSTHCAPARSHSPDTLPFVGVTT